MLVETYLSGREFTVGITGTGSEARIIGVLEVLLTDKAEQGVYSYTNKEEWRDRCRYELADGEIAAACEKVALSAWKILNCEDGGRVDRHQEGVVLGDGAGQLDGVGLVGDVDDAAAEDIGNTLHFIAILAGGTYLDEHQLTLDVRGFGQIDNLDDIDQLVELLGDLLDDFFGADADDGHARQRGIFGRCDGERLDVVASGGEQAGNP